MVDGKEWNAIAFAVVRRLALVPALRNCAVFTSYEVSSPVRAAFGIAPVGLARQRRSMRPPDQPLGNFEPRRQREAGVSLMPGGKPGGTSSRRVFLDIAKNLLYSSTLEGGADAERNLEFPAAERRLKCSSCSNPGRHGPW